MVYGFVKQSGGHIKLYSEEGYGTTFRIYLPCLTAVQGKNEKISLVQGIKPRITGRRVLVVDDNADAAETVAAYLRLEGHDTKVVTEGAEVLGSARVFEPQVVVLDIGLPGLDGYQIARQLRAQPNTKEILLIAVTWAHCSRTRAESRAQPTVGQTPLPPSPRWSLREVSGPSASTT